MWLHGIFTCNPRSQKENHQETLPISQQREKRHREPDTSWILKFCSEKNSYIWKYESSFHSSSCRVRIHRHTQCKGIGGQCEECQKQLTLGPPHQISECLVLVPATPDPASCCAPKKQLMMAQVLGFMSSM